MGGGDTAEEHVTWMLWAPTHPPTDKMASPFFMSAFCYFEFFTWEVYMFFLQLILVFLWSLLMAAMVWAPTTTTRQDGLPPTSLDEIKIPHDFDTAKHRH